MRKNAEMAYVLELDLRRGKSRYHIVSNARLVRKCFYVQRDISDTNFGSGEQVCFRD